MGLFDLASSSNEHDVVSQKAAKNFEKAVEEGMHITHIKKQHPFHPYDPMMDRGHPCFEINTTVGKCFDDDVKNNPDAPLHMRHVACYTTKSELMVCITKYKKQQRLLESQRHTALDKPPA
eukprot:CAMPEP_0174370462 /NCGR_PEP_ID=MMETSP0811_2-20130205/96191_1 /TAXON_ID=73025 ORGANISM="Eutreptiella gymnastica-like, Strain CCMP1594" /NCGR_SAMPLE_ID=MMETSP0811_2 /ASSEMBLY_ACC=CAM_ASM_000667 /LENGTH=120 /DNA_ID=CAMNT_0015515895 /DNA_START=1 /DNA_END=363 /DNA_ORIENTATION=+